MPTIQVKGPAVVFDFQSPEATDSTVPVVENPALLKTLHGLEHDEIFSDYMSDGGDHTLADAGVTGGTLRFEFDETAGVLFGLTKYSAPRFLNKKELSLLKEYTVGQWSDGIGENFTQERMDIGLAVTTTCLSINSDIETTRSIVGQSSKVRYGSKPASHGAR